MTSSPSLTTSVIGTERDTRLVGLPALLELLVLLPLAGRRSRLLWLRPVRALRSLPPRSLRSRPLRVSVRASRGAALPPRAGAAGRATGTGTGAVIAATAGGAPSAAASRPPR